MYIRSSCDLYLFLILCLPVWYKNCNFTSGIFSLVALCISLFIFIFLHIIKYVFFVVFFSCFALYKILTFTFTTTNHVTTYRCIVLYIQTLQLQVCIYICFILYVCMYIVIVFMHVYGIFLLLIIIVMARSITIYSSVLYTMQAYIYCICIYPSPFQIPNHTPCIMLSSSHMRNLRGENRVSISSKSHCLPYHIEGIYNLELD